jgi:hypothetical protein
MVHHVANSLKGTPHIGSSPDCCCLCSSLPITLRLSITNCHIDISRTGPQWPELLHIQMESHQPILSRVSALREDTNRAAWRNANCSKVAESHIHDLRSGYSIARSNQITQSIAHPTECASHSSPSLARPSLQPHRGRGLHRKPVSFLRRKSRTGRRGATELASIITTKRRQHSSNHAIARNPLYRWTY